MFCGDNIPFKAIFKMSLLHFIQIIPKRNFMYSICHFSTILSFVGMTKLWSLCTHWVCSRVTTAGWTGRNTKITVRQSFLLQQQIWIYRTQLSFKTHFICCAAHFDSTFYICLLDAYVWCTARFTFCVTIHLRFDRKQPKQQRMTWTEMGSEKRGCIYSRRKRSSKVRGQWCCCWRDECTVRGPAAGLAALQATQEKLGLGGGLIALSSAALWFPLAVSELICELACRVGMGCSQWFCGEQATAHLKDFIITQVTLQKAQCFAKWDMTKLQQKKTLN